MSICTYLPQIFPGSPLLERQVPLPLPSPGLVLEAQNAGRRLRRGALGTAPQRPRDAGAADPWRDENGVKMVGKTWEKMNMVGKPWENPRKLDDSMGKSWEQSWEKMTMIGKSWENHRDLPKWMVYIWLIMDDNGKNGSFRKFGVPQ